MSFSTGSNVRLPDPEAFIRWVKHSLADLDMRASNFLVDDDKPGSVNRLNNIIKNPQSLRMSLAIRLEREIREEAEKRGVELLPFPTTASYPPLELRKLG